VYRDVVANRLGHHADDRALTVHGADVVGSELPSVIHLLRSKAGDRLPRRRLGRSRAGMDVACFGDSFAARAEVTAPELAAMGVLMGCDPSRGGRARAAGVGTQPSSPSGVPIRVRHGWGVVSAWSCQRASRPFPSPVFGGGRVSESARLEHALPSFAARHGLCVGAWLRASASPSGFARRAPSHRSAGNGTNDRPLVAVGLRAARGGDGLSRDLERTMTQRQGRVCGRGSSCNSSVREPVRQCCR